MHHRTRAQIHAPRYVAGFVESLLGNFQSLPHDNDWDRYFYCTITLFLCLVVCLVGANAFAKASLVIFVVVITSVISCITNFFYAPEKISISCPSDNSFCT